VFVPHLGAEAEDDGWFLSIVSDSKEHHAFAGIVSATDFSGTEDARSSFI